MSLPADVIGNKVTLVLAFGTSVLSGMVALMTPYLDGIVFSFIGWSISMMALLIENGSRKKQYRDLSELVFNIVMYSLIILLFTYLHIYAQHLKLGSIPINTAAYASLTAYLYITYGRIKLMRENFNKRYKKRFDLTWFDNLTKMLRGVIIKQMENKCKLEPQDEEEEKAED